MIMVRWGFYLGGVFAAIALTVVLTVYSNFAVDMAIVGCAIVYLFLPVAKPLLLRVLKSLQGKVL